LKEKEVLSQKDYAQIFLNIDSLLSLNRGLSKDLDDLQGSLHSLPYAVFVWYLP
jgi:hypothetical protein